MNVRRRARWVLSAAILAVVALVAVGWPRARTWWEDRTPYSAAAMRLRLSFSTPERADAQAAFNALGPGGRNLTVDPSPVRQFVVGRLDFTQPAHAPAGSQYVLFVIDRRTNTLPGNLEQYLPGPGLSGGGYDGRFGNFAKRYPWLSATAMVDPDDGGWTDPGSVVSLTPDEKGPVLFSIPLDPRSGPVTDPGRDLTIALGFIADDGHVFWAQQLNG